jgi:hypothetical protein
MSADVPNLIPAQSYFSEKAISTVVVPCVTAISVVTRGGGATGGDGLSAGTIGLSAVIGFTAAVDTRTAR